MRALVTGGGGFIGSHLVDALVSEGHDVVVLDDFSSGRRENVNSRAEVVEATVLDADAVATAAAGCSVVFHLAARRAVLASVEDPLDTDRVNVAGTLTTLVGARTAGVTRVVTSSSSSVYGGARDLPTPETAPLVPRSPYAVSKMASEHYCRVFWELFGLETVCLRYFNVFGPRQRADSRYAAVIPLFIDALRAGRRPEVHGDGRQSRDFTFVDDAVCANLHAASAPASSCAGAAFNVAGGKPCSILELLASLQVLLGTNIEPRHTPPRPGDVRHSYADITAAAGSLGFRPRFSLADGLRMTLADPGLSS